LSFHLTGARRHRHAGQIDFLDHSHKRRRALFSGTATYEKEFENSADRLNAGRELWLDLGAVKNSPKFP